jgi:sensor histidine kinase YesM
MKKMDAKARVRTMTLTFTVALFAVLTLCFIAVSAYITDSTNRETTRIAEQIIERIGWELSQTEKLLDLLVSDERIQRLSAATEPETFKAAAAQAGGVLDTNVFNPSFVESVLIIGTDGHYCRLSGRLDNTSCFRLSGLVAELALPTHLSVTLDEWKYIGYAEKIPFGGAAQAGAAVILIEEQRILEIMHGYDQSESLLMMIKANGETIAANTDKLELFNNAAYNAPSARSNFGITPYEVFIVADEGYMTNIFFYFTVIAAGVALFVAAIIFMYADTMNKRFFRPMVKTVALIENLNTDATSDTLSHVQSQEFDRLIDKLNEMLAKLEAKSSAVRTAELLAATAEIGKQKALMSALKKQISAHFTINTLQTIQLLVKNGKYERAEDVAESLLILFRYAYNTDELIALSQEEMMLSDYVLILNSRFNDKLSIRFDFDNALMDSYIPRMLLQPLVENAFEHGFEYMDKGGMVCVSAELRGDRMFLSVSDNGCGMSADALRALKEKLNARPDTATGYENIALLNIKHRLFLCFGDAGTLDVQSVKGEGTAVTLGMPFPKGGGTE